MSTGPVPTSPALTVICVTYQSRSQVVDALRSAARSAAAAGATAELIVVDNASSDGSADAVAEAYPDAMVLRNDANMGFGAANNRAFAQAGGEGWLLVNPDARLDEGTVGVLRAALARNPRLAAVGPSIAGAGVGGAESAGMLPGVRSLASHFLFLNRLLPRDRGGAWRGWMLRASRRMAPRRVEWLSGAVILLRPEAIREIGGFDETIFLYGEDTDLCARLLQRGWQLELEPSAHAWHAIGASQAPGSTRWVDGIDEFLARQGRSGLSRSLALLSMSVGLAIRGATFPRSADARGHADALRMRNGARRALILSIASLMGKAPASGGQPHRYE